MSRGKEVKKLRAKMGMNRREFSHNPRKEMHFFWLNIRISSRLGSREKRTSRLFTAIVEIQSGNRASNQ